MRNIYIVNKGMYGALDVFGPTIEFLTSPEEVDAYCVMIGTIPPGISVPLHSHPDLESFFLISGTVQAFAPRGNSFEWQQVRPGEFVHVPSNVRHAWRNTSGEPAVQLVTTTPKIGRFFQEIGRPVKGGTPLPPPTPDELQRFALVAAKYNYWIGSPRKMPRSEFAYLRERRAWPRL
jgi:quercetin dioxygenase-like cupin family protein